MKDEWNIAMKESGHHFVISHTQLHLLFVINWATVPVRIQSRYASTLHTSIQMLAYLMIKDLVGETP